MSTHRPTFRQKILEVVSVVFYAITILSAIAFIVFLIIGLAWERSNYVCMEEHEEWVLYSGSPDGTPNVFPIKQKVCSRRQLKNQLQQKIKP